MKGFLNILSLILFLTSAVSTSAQTSNRGGNEPPGKQVASPEGRWCGSVLEMGFGSYTTYMDIHCLEVDSICGTIQYPALGCGGVLHLTRREGDVFVFEEKIQFEWYYPNGDKHATGELFKIR
ncbi:MAG TPA: hypothetical protein VMX75_07550 [Spirochaetia bacterium]|nr:hypothetical protein [Spirochaetia bacterium]